MTPIDILGAILNAVLTSLLSALFVFISLRWILSKVFNPLISGAASIMGKQSGDIRATRAVTNKAAEQFLSGPKIAGLKMIASQLGFDIDGMIEEHGAVNTLAGLQQLAGMLGINIMDFASGGLEGILGGGKGLNPNRSNTGHIRALSEG